MKDVSPAGTSDNMLDEDDDTHHHLPREVREGRHLIHQALKLEMRDAGGDKFGSMLFGKTRNESRRDERKKVLHDL